MGFGLFKKLKDGFKKAAKWMKYKVIQPSIDVIKKTKPILEKVDLKPFKPYIPNYDKIEQLKNKTLEFSQQSWQDEVRDDVIKLDDMMENKEVPGLVEYAGRKFIPRLKLK